MKYGKYSPDHSGRRVLKILGARDILGLEMLFCRDPCSLSGFAKGLEDTQVMFIESLERHPAVFRYLYERLSQEILFYQCKIAELAHELMRVNLAHGFGARGRTGWRSSSTGVTSPSSLGRTSIPWCAPWPS